MNDKRGKAVCLATMLSQKNAKILFLLDMRKKKAGKLRNLQEIC